MEEVIETDYTKTVPEDILKIQKKLACYKVGSRNYKKYQKILAKHIKAHTMEKRVKSNIKTIETIQKISSSTEKN
jgi:hypothetical protein